MADIAARPLPNAGRAAVPAGSESVAAAMEALDYSHRIGGRPVAGDVLDPVDRIVARVIQHVIDQSGRARPDAALVAEAARRYRAVEPWPFAALTHPVAPGAPLAPVRVEHRVGRREHTPPPCRPPTLVVANHPAMGTTRPTGLTVGGSATGVRRTSWWGACWDVVNYCRRSLGACSGRRTALLGR